MQTTVRFAGLICRFFSPVSDTAGSWRWKLDPYQIPSLRECDLAIDLAEHDLDETIFLKKDGLVRAEQSGFYQHQVFKRDNGETIWRYVRSRSERLYLSYSVSPQWDRITLLQDHTQTGGDLAFEYLGRIVPSILVKHDILTFHGVLMEYRGRGIIIAAASGTGKTSHARLWRDLNRALILNGDRSTVRISDGVWTGFGLPWSGTSGEQMNRSVPLSALVILERGEQNEAHSITGMEAFGAALPHVPYPAWDIAMTDRAVDLLDHFLRSVPVIRLSCRPDSESVDVLRRALEKL